MQIVKLIETMQHNEKHIALNRIRVCVTRTKINFVKWCIQNDQLCGCMENTDRRYYSDVL